MPASPQPCARLRGAQTGCTTSPPPAPPWDGLIEAVSFYRGALSWAPDQACTLRALGLALLSLDRADEAIAPLTQLAAISPGDPASHRDLGRAQLACHHLDAARENFFQALALRPADADTHSLIGHVENAAGRDAEAEAAYRRALSCGSRPRRRAVPPRPAAAEPRAAAGGDRPVRTAARGLAGPCRGPCRARQCLSRIDAVRSRAHRVPALSRAGPGPCAGAFSPWPDPGRMRPQQRGRRLPRTRDQPRSCRYS